MEELTLDRVIDQVEAEVVSDLICENATSSFTDILQFNFSEYDYPGDGGYGWPPSLDLTSGMKITFCVINMIVSIMGNTAVIIAVYHNPALRSTINFYLVNVAVADVLIALCCMWPHLVNDLTKPAYVLGAFMCKFNAFAQMTCLTSSVLTLTAISCDRFMAVMHPLRVRITQCRARAVIITIWIISILVSIPFAVFRKLFEIQWKNVVEVTCQETWPVMNVYFDPVQLSCVASIWPKTVYYSLVSATLFFLPIAVMTIAYALIIVRLWGSKPPGEKMDAALSNQAKATRKVIKMVLVILLVFLICWVPLQILILYAQFSHNSKESGELPQWYDHVMFLVYSIAYTNSTLNPLLYGGLNQTYRKTLIRVLCNKCCQCREGRDSFMSIQGSLQMAEFRAGNHQAHLTNGGCNTAAQSGARTTTTTTRTNNSRRGILAISNGQTASLLTPTRENSARQWRAGPSMNSKPTGTSQFLQPPSNKHVGGNSSAELDLISGIETDTSFGNASRANRSSGHRRRHQELAN